LQWARDLVEQVRTKSFPELAGVRIAVRPLHSKSDFFQARFSLRRKYTVYANPMAVDAPGLAAIVAHELEHIVYYRTHNRLQWLGLMALMSEGKQAKFEKAADYGAIRRGYGERLAQYRHWLYAHVDPKTAARKRRVYLTPDEIKAARARRQSASAAR
jgi:hypothetical protein